MGKTYRNSKKAGDGQFPRPNCVVKESNVGTRAAKKIKRVIHHRERRRTTRQIAKAMQEVL